MQFCYQYNCIIVTWLADGLISLLTISSVFVAECQKARNYFMVTWYRDFRIQIHWTRHCRVSVCVMNQSSVVGRQLQTRQPTTQNHNVTSDWEFRGSPFIIAAESDRRPAPEKKSEVCELIKQITSMSYTDCHLKTLVMGFFWLVWQWYIRSLGFWIFGSDISLRYRINCSSNDCLKVTRNSE